MLPSKRTLQKGLHHTNTMPGLNDAICDELKMKVEAMNAEDRCVSQLFNEMTLRPILLYNHGLHIVEGFEDLQESDSPLYQISLFVSLFCA